MSGDNVRKLVQDALSKGLYATAIILAQELLILPESSLTDKFLHARCYFHNGEYRRCIASLEQGGFLATEAIRSVYECFHNEEFQQVGNVLQKFDVTLAVDAMLLAAQCLFAIDQFDDCILLLEPFVLVDDNEALISQIISRARKLDSSSSVNSVAAIYCIIGKCYDMVDNRVRSIRSLHCSIKIDPQCVEAAQLLSTGGLLTTDEKRSIFTQLNFCADQEWLKKFYQSLSPPTASWTQTTKAIMTGSKSAAAYVRHAEHLVETLHRPDEAYRSIRQAYAMDPFDQHCVRVYVACLVELNLKTELFYLGHELTNTLPKLPLSWFAVGCYYWSCKKFDMAQNFLRKCTKLDKRFGGAFVVLGLVLSAQEESEQAISSFRTAARLMPGDHRPLVLLAKELVRTSYDSLALHFLNSALVLVPEDPVALNELGVVYLRLQRDEDAIYSLEKAANLAIKNNFHSSEIFNNFATALRRSGRYRDALYWFEAALAENPHDASVLASIGFTMHLMRRFEEAISTYHRALAVNPASTFCAELLTRAMDDCYNFEHYNQDYSSKSECQPSQAIGSTFSPPVGIRSQGRPVFDTSLGMFQLTDTMSVEGNHQGATP